MPMHGRIHMLQADHTWGYSGTGEKASGGACMSYAEPFGPGDEVTCILDLTATEPTLTFAKNGVLLGVVRFAQGVVLGTSPREGGRM